MQWAWGLDAHHDTETGVPPERVNENTTRVGVDPNGPDRNVRQATVNLFADMGVQPATLAPDLVRTEASEDREPPVSRIDEPRTGSSLPPGPVQVSGASHDRGGGCVAAVEVSVDGGASLAPRRGARGVALRMEARRVGHPDDYCAGRSTTAATSKRPPRASPSPSPCQRRREGQGAVRPRTRRHDQAIVPSRFSLNTLYSAHAETFRRSENSGDSRRGCSSRPARRRAERGGRANHGRRQIGTGRDRPGPRKPQGQVRRDRWRRSLAAAAFPHTSLSPAVRMA